MSKTFIYALGVIAVYVMITFSKGSASSTKKTEKKEENEVSQVESEQQKNKVGWTL